MLTYTYYYDVWLEEVVSGKKLCAPMEQEEGLESTKWKLVHCEPDVPVILTVSHPPTRPPAVTISCLHSTSEYLSQPPSLSHHVAITDLCRTHGLPCLSH